MKKIVMKLADRLIRLNWKRLEEIQKEHPGRIIEFFSEDGRPLAVRSKTDTGKWDALTIATLRESDFDCHIQDSSVLDNGHVGVWVALFPKDKKRKPFKEEQI